MKTTKGEPSHKYPWELDSLLEKKFLFKVSVMENNIEEPKKAAYHVQKICTDCTIIKSFIAKYKLDEVFSQKIILRSNWMPI